MFFFQFRRNMRETPNFLTALISLTTKAQGARIEIGMKPVDSLLGKVLKYGRSACPQLRNWNKNAEGLDLVRSDAPNVCLSVQYVINSAAPLLLCWSMKSYSCLAKTLSARRQKWYASCSTSSGKNLHQIGLIPICESRFLHFPCKCSSSRGSSHPH